MTITLSDNQGRAIAAIRDWYETRRHEQQIFRLFGYAGTGKTTITAMAVEALGLEPMTPGGLGGVLFAAFTGKAALVMTRKGTPAQTIHSLIYRVSEATPEEIARATEDLAALRRDLPRMGPAERGFAMTRIAQLELRLEHPSLCSAQLRCAPCGRLHILRQQVQPRVGRSCHEAEEDLALQRGTNIFHQHGIQPFRQGR